MRGGRGADDRGTRLTGLFLGSSKASLLCISILYRAACCAASCVAGEYAKGAACLPCAPGSFNGAAQHQETACSSCSPGSYSPLPGMSECWSCPRNSSSGAGSGVCTPLLPCSPCIDRSKVKIRAVVHGLRSDAFWLRVERAMLLAAENMKIDFAVHLQIRTNSEAMRDMIREVVAEEKPDVLLATIPNAVVLPAIKEAAQVCHVFTLNSGSNDFLQVGSKAHFSMDEELGGYQSMGRFSEAFTSAGSSLAACAVLNLEVGNSALDSRREGYKRACAEQGIAWLGEYATVNSNVDEHKQKVAQVISDFSASAAAASSGGGLGLLVLGAQAMAGAKQAFRDAGSPSSVKLGSFDLGADIYSGIEDGEVLFGIDQNEWLQGYLPVVISTLYITTGNLMAPTLYPTGPSFMTEAPTPELSAKAAEAFPVCECPWVGGREDAIDCSAGVPSIEAIGSCPLAEGSCASPCVDARTFKLRGLTHGPETDAFWFVVKAGADQAANDLRLIDFEMDLWGPPGSDRSDAFTNERFAAKITETADDPTVDGIFVSLHGPHVYSETTYAAGKKLVVTINSGYEISASLNPPGGSLIGHVGMDEKQAGKGAGKVLAEAGASHVLCILPEVGNSALDARCNGAAESMQELGGSLTTLNLVTEGVEVNSDDSISQHLLGVLQADSSIDATLCGGALLVPPTLAAIKGAGKAPGDFWAGSFDSSEALLGAMSAGEFFMFGVDQQQYMQGYMAVVQLYMRLVAGQRLAEHVTQSGPFFVRGADATKDACIATKWATTAPGRDGPIVGERFLPERDPQLVTGFPVCEYHGSCKDESEVFDMERGECVACLAGTYKTATMSECATCPDGQSTNGEARSKSCAPCALGRFALGGDAECSNCEKGSYASRPGLSECARCSAPFSTENIAQTSNESCMCPAGMYGTGGSYIEGGACLPCPEEMECLFGSDVRFFPAGTSSSSAPGRYPLVNEGFMTQASDPLVPYRCLGKSKCPGGAPGACAANRDASKVACAGCLEGSFEDGDACTVCPPNTGALPVVGAILGGIVGTASLTIIMNRGMFMKSQAWFVVVIMTALMLINIQALGVFSQLDIGWFEPMWSILNFVSMFALDLRVFRLGCAFATNPTQEFVLRQFVAPCALPCALVTLLVKKYNPIEKWRVPDTDILKELTNAIGTLFSVFFIPMVLSSVAPVICFKHPGDAGWSVQTSPGVLCNFEVDHTTMFIWGIVSLFLVPFPFIAIVAYGTWRYPSAMNSPGSSAFLEMYRFLFFRYQPCAYYYGFITVLRSLCICSIPVVIRGDAGLQVIFLVSIVIGFSQLQCHLRPWRASMCNVIDGLLASALVIILVCAALAAQIDIAADSLRYVGTFAFCSMVVSSLVTGVVVLYMFIRPNPFFSYFLCHHKGHAAAQVRALKMFLVGQTGKTVFIDSDDLLDLDALFDVVKCRVGRLVVYLTSATLTRGWCAGEIVTASRIKLNTTRVMTDSFVPPSAEQMENLDTYIDTSGCNLPHYGITMEDVVTAYTWLVGSADLPTVHLNRSLEGSYRFKHLAAQLVSQSAMSKPPETPQPAPVKRGAVLISGSREDDESIAAGVILSMMLQETVYRICDEGLVCLPDHAYDAAGSTEMVMHARAVIIVLSVDTLRSRQQLKVIVDSMVALEAELLPSVVPVNLPAFAFPTDAYYADVLPSVWPEHSGQVGDLIKQLFKRIAIVLPTSASERALETQAVAIVARVPSKAGGQSRSPKAAGGAGSAAELVQWASSLGLSDGPMPMATAPDHDGFDMDLMEI